MDFDFSCLDTPDFGFASSFSSAPLAEFMPQIKPSQRDDPMANVESEINEIKIDGFCMKLAPGENVSSKYLVNSRPNFLPLVQALRQQTKSFSHSQDR